MAINPEATLQRMAELKQQMKALQVEIITLNRERSLVVFESEEILRRIHALVFDRENILQLCSADPSGKIREEYEPVLREIQTALDELNFSAKQAEYERYAAHINHRIASLQREHQAEAQLQRLVSELASIRRKWNEG